MLITSIGFVAGALTTVAFLPQIIKTLRVKETGDISLGLCVFNAIAASLWFTYGLLTLNWPLIIPNAIASVLAFILLSLKLIYRSPVGAREAAILMIALIAMLGAFGVAVFTPLSLVSVVSSGAVVFAPLSFATQVFKTAKLKKTKDISLGMYVIFWIGVVLWLVYGALLKDGPIVINNVVMLSLTSTMLFFKLKYK